jgi:hypothetical protein
LHGVPRSKYTSFVHHITYPEGCVVA